MGLHVCAHMCRNKEAHSVLLVLPSSSCGPVCSSCSSQPAHLDQTVPRQTGVRGDACVARRQQQARKCDPKLVLDLARSGKHAGPVCLSDVSGEKCRSAACPPQETPRPSVWLTVQSAAEQLNVLTSNGGLTPTPLALGRAAHAPASRLAALKTLSRCRGSKNKPRIIADKPSPYGLLKMSTPPTSVVVVTQQHLWLLGLGQSCSRARPYISRGSRFRCSGSGRTVRRKTAYH